ncbi:MAG: FtsX-like permease family protein [Ruthenibacterium sp.]
MKSYLELVPISAKVHRKQNRMSILCIVLAVFLVTVIFGMADMFIRSQLLQTQKEYGNWHISVRDISDRQAADIASRDDVAAISSYGVFNFRGEDGCTLGGKSVAICGSDEAMLTQIQTGALLGGHFPQGTQEALITKNARDALHLRIGDEIAIETPLATQLHFTVSGIAGNATKLMSEDSYGVFLSTEGFRSIYPNPKGTQPADYNSVFYVQFSDTSNIKRSIADMTQSLGIRAEQVSENTQLLALLGQGSNAFALQIYAVAAVLFVLVLIAGSMMIAGSLNNNVIGRTQFFGMMRCIGATKKQVKRIVRREALHWCAVAIPLGVVIGVVLIWVLCFILRVLSPDYFGEMPRLSISWMSILSGCVLGLLTVLLASRAPAKRASKSSPLAAALGNTTALPLPNKAANTGLFRIDTALGIRHTLESKKNYILMSSSFALSIILFLSFSVTIAFMHHALNSLDPWSPDVSIASKEDAGLIPGSFTQSLRTNPAVKRAYGRMAATNLGGTVNGQSVTVSLISYEENQFDWAGDYLLEGSVQRVQEELWTGMLVYDKQRAFPVGSTVVMEVNGQTEKIAITGILSDAPFQAGDQGITIICSEETFSGITGTDGYTVVDLQLTRSATDEDVAAIRKSAGEGYTFSDKRLSNSSAKGSYYSFGLFIYGFLAVIALVTVCNIVNSIAMSTAARTGQYGILRAVGLSDKQLARMITTEATAYAITGSVLGTAIGLFFHYALFSMLISAQWGDAWRVPVTELGVILVIIVGSVVAAVRMPIQRIRRKSIVDTINAH